MYPRWLSMLPVLLVITSSLAAAPAAPAKPTARVIYGLHEQVFITGLGVVLPAKVDTGADSSSLSAINIRPFTRGGERWVRFDLAVEGMELNDVELPLSHNVRIRRRASDYDPEEEKYYARRPVVELMLCIGNRAAAVNVNLADRRGFRQPLLLGASALREMRALVDSEFEYSAGVPLCEGVEDARRYPPLGDDKEER
ncbi:RimK/LysX family protein [Alcanivorax sp. 1008]|uniref:ATP-dependent zinc protease family protein n=1 Tax=Alcanivorax sp. 1008 TaxID=2816853 RepID=UPI001DB7F8D1|nr:RimK/LysX family protein [Alcanivorax sp. 1008]MCC1495795.1 ATP-dependent zinc protease [Alcanivorax sp. 1008]